jgi:vacuolar-type H+-ATPase subunit I/STV1
MLALNAQQILEDNQVFAPGQKQAFYMRSLQITANLQLRGIFTSDIKYTVATLPKEMAFKILKGQDWFGLYGWIDYPAASGEERADKENEATNNVNSLSSVRAPKSQVKSKSKSVKFTSEDRKIESLEEEKIQTKIERNTLESQPHQEINETLERQELIEKTVRDIEDIKNQYCMSLEEKNLQSNAEVTLFYN